MKLRRIVTLLAVALVLGTMLALGVFAEDVAPFSITTGNGQITSGLDFENYTYKITPVRLADSATPKLFGDHYVDFLPDTAETVSVKVPSGIIPTELGGDGEKKYPGYENISVYKYQTSNEQVASEKTTVTYYAPQTYYTQIANKNLAGFYKIKRFDKTTGAVSGDAITFYVKGLKADREAIASKGIIQDDNTTGNAWNPGYMSPIAHMQTISYQSGYTKFTPGSHKGRVSSNGVYANIWFIQGNATDYPAAAYLLLNTYTKDINEDGSFKTGAEAAGKGVTWKAYTDALNMYSYKYALQSTEIVPANEFMSFTYDIEKSTGSYVDVGSANTKLHVLVYNLASGEFKTYEATDDAFTASVFTEYVSNHPNKTRVSRHTITAGDLACGEDKLSDIGDGWYIVGYEVFPCTDVDPSTLSIERNLTSSAFEAGYDGAKGHANYVLTIHHDKYKLASNVLPKNISYDSWTRTVSGLTGGLEYYVSTYDAAGISESNAEKLIVENDSATLPEDFSGLLAIYAKGDEYLSDSKPFIFYTYNSEAGKFNTSTATYTEGVTTVGADLLSPGNYRLPNISSIERYGLHSAGVAFRLRGTTFTSETFTKEDGVTTATGRTITSHHNERYFDYVGLYYGFTSTQAFPIKYFEGMTMPSTYLVQGETTTEYIRESGEETYTAVKNVTALNGNMTGHLVLYYVTEDGAIGTYVIKGNVLSYCSADISSFAKYEFLPSNDDVLNLKALGDAFVIGYALLPYNERNYNEGEEHLFNHYCNSGGNVYIKIKNPKTTDTTHCAGFALSDIADGEAPSHISGVNGRFVSSIENDTNYYQYAPVTLSDKERMGVGSYSVPAELENIAAPGAGLFAIRACNEDVSAFSDPHIVYFPSTTTDRSSITLKDGHAEGHPKYQTATGSTGNTYIIDTTVPTAGQWTNLTYIHNRVIGTNDDYYIMGRTGARAIKVSDGTSVSFQTYQSLLPDAATEVATTAQNNYKEAFENYYFLYTYAQSEVIRASEFLSFTYGTSLRQGNINVGPSSNRASKMAILSMQPNGTVKTYEKIHDTKQSSTGTDFTETILKYTAADFVGLSEDKGYIIGIKIYPMIPIDAKEIYGSGTSNVGHIYNVKILHERYEVDLPRYDTPSAVCDSRTGELTITDYDADISYGIVPLSADVILSETVDLSGATKLELDKDGKITLDESAGLYGVVAMADDRFCQSNGYSMIYIRPADSTIKPIGDINSTNGYPEISSASDWETGVWTGKIDHINDDNDFTVNGTNYVLSNGGAQITKISQAQEGDTTSYQEIIYSNLEGAEDAKAEIAAEVNALSHKYAYMGEEIIPASDFISFTYKVGVRQGNVRFAAKNSNVNTNTKLVVYVVDPETNTVTPYEKEINEPSMAIRDNAGRSNPIVVTAETLLNDGKALNTANGYVVGIEIFPLQIKEASELYALKASYDPDKNSETAQYYVNGSFNVDIVYKDYTFKLSPDAPTITLVEGGDAINVENYNESFVYKYKAEGDDEWTTLTESTFDLYKAGTKYTVKIFNNKYSYASDASEATSHIFVPTETSLVLGGEIGIKTTFDVAEGAALAIEGCYYQDGGAVDYKMTEDGKSIIVYVPAKDKALNLVYKYAFGDSTVTRDIYTVTSYISTAKEDYKDNVTNLNLVNALDGYTTQAGIYFDEEATATEYTATNSLAEATVDNPVATFDDDFKKAYRGTALILEGKTAIRHYFDATSAEQYTVTIGGETVTVHYDDLVKYYYVDVEDISATDYGVQYEVKIGENSVKYSVLNYLKNKNGADTKIGNLARAMYDYHKAAVAFEASK